jgi:hypothetical protein
MQSLEKFISYFFDGINISIKDDENNNENDGIIYDIQDEETCKKKLNIMLCVENCTHFHHYKHFNKFNRYNNPDIKIFFYNFIDKIETNTEISDHEFIAIPIIYLQINYFQKYYDQIQPLQYTKFENKKFCLIATSLNSYHKCKIYEKLNNIGKCDLISNYVNIIEHKSVYHDTELLNLFNQYLFVFVCENSVADGYITEKIFNCYFARTIPIYYGCKKIINYFNKDSFINISDKILESDDNLLKSIINKFKKVYESQITERPAALWAARDATEFGGGIVHKNYYDENYKEQINSFINTHY